MPMSSASGLPFQTVLCALDFEPGSARALVLAADIAERAHADLRLLHVNPQFRARLAKTPGGDAGGAFRQRVERFVNHTLGADDAFEVLAPHLHEAHGETASDGVVRHARHVQADLVVVGSHGRRGLDRLLLGSVAADVLRQASAPVLIVPDRAEQAAPGPDHPILVAVDFSGHTRPALRLATALAETYKAPVEIVHVLEDQGAFDLGGLLTVGDLRQKPGATARATAHSALQMLADESGVSAAEVHVETGAPETAIVRLAEERGAGAVVMGTHGRSGWDRLRLGSVAEWVVRHAPCPTFALPAALAEEDEASAADPKAIDEAR
jgi:nucleotide-binding universal stress UspA family protein